LGLLAAEDDAAVLARRDSFFHQKLGGAFGKAIEL
jgi:hypothetical protein